MTCNENGNVRNHLATTQMVLPLTGFSSFESQHADNSSMSATQEADHLAFQVAVLRTSWQNYGSRRHAKQLAHGGKVCVKNFTSCTVVS